MKKLFYVLAIAALAACNSGGNGEEVKPADTTATTPAATDAQPATTAPAMDTTAKADTSAADK
jgi:hypothetical protein